MRKTASILMAAAAALCAGTALAQQVKPVCTENSGACMTRTASLYLDAIVSRDPSKIPVAADVLRTEQGRITARNEAELRDSMTRMPAMLGRTGTRWVVDEKQGMVVAYTRLRIPDAASSPPPSERTYKRPSPEAITTHLVERFRVDKGLIREIEAIFYQQTGTSEGESHWPEPK